MYSHKFVNTNSMPTESIDCSCKNSIANHEIDMNTVIDNCVKCVGLSYCIVLNEPKYLSLKS